MSKRSRGRPRNVETPEELLELFEGYKKEKGVNQDGVKNLLTLAGFMCYLYDKGIIKGISNYWYELPSDFINIKKDIEMMMENHWQQATSKKEIDTAFGIFYGKNKFGYVDKIESTNTNKNIQVDELDSVSDEELKKIAGITDE